MVELKHGSERFPAIEGSLARAIEASNRLDDAIVISRNIEAIKCINKIKPDIMTLDFKHPPIASPAWLHSKALSRAGKRYVIAGAGEIDPGRIRRVRRLGYGVVCSNINEEWGQQSLDGALAASVDGIFTDHVPELERALRR